jgi:dephospho-CoA kinase
MVRALILVGRIASGKTSVATLVAKQLPDIEVVTVSSVVARLAAERGADGSSRSALQRFGLELIERQPALLAQGLAARVPEQGTLIVDGLRSAAVLGLLREIFEEDVRSVYLDAPTRVRKARYDRRRDVNEAPFEDVDAHAVEEEVEVMRTLTDRQIDASVTLDEVVVQVIDVLSQC